MSAYNSVPEQTDSSPCIGAGGDICNYDGCVVANNALPLGATVELEGIGNCTVMDRLNARYNDQPHRFDLYMGKDVTKAKQFGVRKLAYKVL